MNMSKTQKYLKLPLNGEIKPKFMMTTVQSALTDKQEEKLERQKKADDRDVREYNKQMVLELGDLVQDMEIVEEEVEESEEHE